jgi:hypothetical protein
VRAARVLAEIGEVRGRFPTPEALCGTVIPRQHRVVNDGEQAMLGLVACTLHGSDLPCRWII